MSFIPIMEVSKNGTEALEKKEEERDKVDQEVSQEEEIEGTRSMIAKEGPTPAIDVATRWPCPQMPDDPHNGRSCFFG